MLDWLQPLEKVLYPQYEGRIRVFNVAAQCSTVWTQAYKWLHIYVPTPICSDCSTYVPTPLCSDTPMYRLLNLCSDTPMFRLLNLCSDTPMFRLLNLYSDTPMFRLLNLCSDTPMFRLLSLCSDTPMCRHAYVPTPYMWDWVTTIHNILFIISHSTVINVA